MLNPPGGVDIVACFLRRVGAANRPEYALDVLNRQFAALATDVEYQSSDHLPYRFQDFRSLLADAGRACTERDRRLLIVVDGLDEYGADPFGLDEWLPGPGSLGPNTSVLTSSRTGAHVDLVARHPLRDTVWRIDASAAAQEIQQRAEREIDWLRMAAGSPIRSSASSPPPTLA